VVTLLGFRLAGKKPDPEHPFGHGRMEYLSGLVVSALILLMGVELAKSSFQKILHPEAVEFSVVAVVILLASIAVKLYMSVYNRTIGKKINSAAMVATGIDSLSDTISTVAVLIAMVVGKFSGLMIDGWVGMVVALFILYSACRAAMETVGPLLGQPAEPEFVERIQELVMAHEEVCGIHDLVVHDYGPGRVMISLHAEVPASGDILEIHDMIDGIEAELREQLDCEAVIHMDPIVTDDTLTTELRMKMAALVKEVDERATIHDFRMVIGPTHTNLIFDAVVPFGGEKSNHELEEEIKARVRQMEGTYFAVVRVENSYL
jgi:cation diffusion facilitator family transporter